MKDEKERTIGGVPEKNWAEMTYDQKQETEEAIYRRQLIKSHARKGGD